MRGQDRYTGDKNAGDHAKNIASKNGIDRRNRRRIYGSLRACCWN